MITYQTLQVTYTATIVNYLQIAKMMMNVRSCYYYTMIQPTALNRSSVENQLWVGWVYYSRYSLTNLSLSLKKYDACELNNTTAQNLDYSSLQHLYLPLFIIQYTTICMQFVDTQLMDLSLFYIRNNTQTIIYILRYINPQK